MCHRRQIARSYAQCGHVEAAPEMMVQCSSARCRFSPYHPVPCKDCRQTCLQYRTAPEQYTLTIEGFCTSCARSAQNDPFRVGRRFSSSSSGSSTRVPSVSSESRSRAPSPILGILSEAEYEKHIKAKIILEEDSGTYSDELEPGTGDIAEALPLGVHTEENSPFEPAPSLHIAVKTDKRDSPQVPNSVDTDTDEEKSSIASESLSENANFVLCRPAAHRTGRYCFKEPDPERRACLESSHSNIFVLDCFAADDWLQEHQADDTIKNLAKETSFFPLASHLSVESQVIAVFCDDIRDPNIIRQCKELASTSDFPVLIRPSSEYPRETESFNSLKQNAKESRRHASSCGESSKGNSSSQGGTSSNSSSKDSAGATNPNGNKSSEESDDESDSESGRGGKGGAGPPDPSGSRQPKGSKKISHETNVSLKFSVNGQHKEDPYVKVFTSTSFYPEPNPFENGEEANKPQITGCTDIEVRSYPPMQIDFAYTSTGFLVDDVSYFRGDKPIDEKPQFKCKYGQGKQRSVSMSGTLGLSSGSPKASASVTKGGQNSSSVEYSEDQALTSSFISSHQWTSDGWDEPEKGSFRTVDHYISRWPPESYRMKGFNDISELATKCGLRVFTKDYFSENSPTVSFVFRTQIHIWVKVDDNSRPRGIVILSSPNHYTSEKVLFQ